MNAIIIDDEYSNRILLASMLAKHCPEVTVIGDAKTVDEAYELILEVKPDLIFLDIKMPKKNGFDLLRLFEQINFDIIFVTGFDEYAVKAFEFSAVDYLLKPLDYAKLIAAVKKVESKQFTNTEKLIHFVYSLEEKTNYIKKITIHGKDKVNVIDINDIIYISANRGYCEILDVKKRKHISAKPLAEYEEILEPIKNFIRVNKSYLINTQHILSYTKGNECVVSMNGTDDEIEVSRRKKTEILMLLKEK